MFLRATLPRLSGLIGRQPLGCSTARRMYSASQSGDADIDAMLAKPTWSVRSLLPEESTKQSAPSVTPTQLRHLLRLSALPQPANEEEEKKMLETLESQIHFVKQVQRIDATGVEPLQSIRDESPEAVQENTIGLEQLKEALSKERVVGRNKRIQRVESPRNERPDGDTWDGNALAYASRTKGKFFIFGSGPSPSPAPPKSDRDQDLTTILDRPQRADLTVLVAEITQHMRDAIVRNFHGPIQKENDTSRDQSTHEHHKDTDPLSAQSDAQREETTAVTTQSEYKLTAQDLKSEAKSLSSFDDWRDSVLLRIGEVVNRDEESEEDPSESDSPQQLREPDIDEDQGSLEKLCEVYRPVETPLTQLPKAKRLLILHSLLLLMLSLEHYNARSRVLMLYVASSLNLDVTILNGDESKVARGLLDTALQLANAEEGQEKKRDSSRKWKVGIASVAGAALIGITGGLAAPLVAAGLGTVLGGLGLGATAAAGYLGALAGSGVIVGGLFGAYGGRMTGRMVDKYAREVDDFAFLPIRGSRQRSEDEREAAQNDHMLRVTIGITGWVTEEDNFVVPWRVIGADSEVFGLRWETEPLMKLGNAMNLLVTSAAWAAGGQVLSRTIFAQIMSAVMLPLGLLKVARVADNPFSIAKARADKAGEVLADALISKVQGERAVTLIGYSMGSRVIFSCLQSLAKRGAYDLVESAILMGSPTPSNAPHWRRLRSVVSGRLINVYSENDAVLALLYRTSSLQLGVAGLQSVQDVPGVENLDVSETVSGHLRYQFLIGRILGLVGLQSVDAEEVAREEAALAVKDKKQEQERIQNERRAGVKGDESAQRVLDNGDGTEEEAIHAEVEQETQDRLFRMEVSEGSEGQPARSEFKIKRRPLPSEQS
ncbi:hypothetical protein ASPNIDRAFT_173432 [Aspergillus niger ATCC 1015]|uniref:Glutamyl-tRNA amidotransferase complex subunit Gta3 domain-containing protein n=1 Tax=Aspergillus niger (strain ATCC 1015 / CBS 113.46 / FGSC A1144 / LSHB Ac4 / NCTC 3858a / NRRL 328 / USDA 3528.7) TaxID=380704 RepID=G3Y1P0_ASPNA|nr:hypothetical protein ASPNIDRAFT_173432 [Aspergillus niger ATCC 1015]